MKKKVAILIDGWYMRKRIYKTQQFYYSGKGIRAYCKKHIRPDEELYRIFYYDSSPLEQRGHNPISKRAINFSTTQVGKDQVSLLNSIKETPNFALRLGIAKWPGNSWKINSTPLQRMFKGKLKFEDLTDGDVSPVINQKGVDMKFGLDLASIAYKKLAQKVIVITGDQDFVPALKFARREGLIVGLDHLNGNVNPALLEHIDFLKTFIDNPTKTVNKNKVHKKKTHTRKKV